MIKGTNEILEYLKSEGIEVLEFSQGGETDTGVEPTRLKLKIQPEDEKKWFYFIRRVNDKEKIVSGFYNDGVFTITFNARNTPVEKALLEQDMATLLCKLQNKYYRVCPQRKRFSVLVKPTHRCNLNCKYCYDKPYRDVIHQDMSMETLDRLIKLLSEYAEQVRFIWHGGEPTMVGQQWYHRAYREVFSKYPMVEFSFSIMSNGVNLNDEWLDLFDKYNISVGVSYNAFFQTKIRVSSQTEDKGINAKMSNHIEEMLIKSVKRGKPIGVIDVMTSVNGKHLIEIYEYYKKIGIQPCFNTVFHTAQAAKNNLEINAEEYAEAFLKYFEYWLRDKNGIRERSAYEILSMVTGLHDVTCKHHDCRRHWLGVNPLGELYPCDRYFPDKYKMGSIFDYDNIEDIFNSRPYQIYCEEIQKRFDTICKECGYWFACRGGCNGSAVECTGSAEGVEKFTCRLFRLKYNGVYKILRDIDWVTDKDLNPVARKVMIRSNFYSVKNIRDYIEENNIPFKLEYNENDLLNCSEYKVFRGINYVKDLDEYVAGMHHDVIDSYTENDIEYNLERRKEDLKTYLLQVAKTTLDNISRQLKQGGKKHVAKCNRHCAGCC